MKPPTHVSEEAASFYRDHPGPLPQFETYPEGRNAIHPMWEAARELLGFPYEMEPVTVGGVACARITTDTTTDDGRILVYFPGGSYTMGNPWVHATVALQVAEYSGIPVISVDYRKAPEDPYPAGLNDSVAVVRALQKQHDPRLVGLFGDSAGGGLTLAVTSVLRDAGDPMPGAIVPMSPWADLTGTSDTIGSIGEHDPDFGHDPLDTYTDGALYAGAHPLTHPLISPVYGDFAEFPPTLIQVGAREILLSDSLRVARTMRETGVQVTLDVWDGMWHVWQMFANVPEAQQACREIAAFFDVHLPT